MAGAQGSVIHTTAHHPFWTPQDQKWTDAGNLVAGTTLSSTNDVTTTVKSVHTFTGSMTMYNLTVDYLHTYYVLAGNHPILVHNVDCPQIALGAADSDMAQVAMDFRMKNRLDPGQNVAVFRTGTGANAHYYVATNEPGARHSEEVIDAYLEANGIGYGDVTVIYSERIPCTTHECARLVGEYEGCRAAVQFELGRNRTESQGRQ